MELTELKQRLRKLKHLEEALRHGQAAGLDGELVWNRFFDLNGGEKVKYPLTRLLGMSPGEYRKAAEEYLAFVYGRFFDRPGPDVPLCYDATLLEQLGLPFDADEQAVKKRIRLLAKEYHPDAGGDPEQFIHLMNLYRQLIGK